MPIDPILSFFVAAVLVWGGWRLVRETTLELMEALPHGFDIMLVQQHLQQVKGVAGVHHIHVWKLPNAKLAASAHIEIEAMEDWPQILLALQGVLAEHHVEHVTLQAERVCCLESKEGNCR
jgi:cobalt-zinc-cadmium efflux system protein